MYNTKVVTGKIIEIRDDQVVTLQGDTVSTFHMRYYMMVNEEPLPLTEKEAAESEALMVSDSAETDSAGVYRRDWKPLFSWLNTWKKSANRA